MRAVLRRPIDAVCCSIHGDHGVLRVRVMTRKGPLQDGCRGKSILLEGNLRAGPFHFRCQQGNVSC